MKIHRFIISMPIAMGPATITDQEVVGQITRVLRLKKGEQIILGDGNLNEGLATITGFSKDSIEVEIASVSKNANEPANNAILYCAVLKRENFEWVIQKATELGVKEIVPVLSKRTVKLNVRQDRLEKIIKEAAEQSGRGIVPVLHEPLSFKKALDHAKSNKLNLFFDSSGKALNPMPYTLNPIGIWVGPEGGWDTTELALANNNQFEVVSLGKLTLRAETAAVVACYVANHFNSSL